MPFRRRAVGISFAALLAALAVSPAARADAPAQAEFEEATRLFERGSQLFLQRRYREALELMERSYQLHPSPNSLLIIARCERDLGRFELAAERFAKAASAAEARVSAGEAQYRETAESARNEGAAVRAMLGTIRVRVADAPPGTVVETRFARSLLDASGNVELQHRPGRFRVTVRTPGGQAVERTVSVSARAWADLQITLEEPSPAPSGPPLTDEPSPAPAPESDAPSWMLPTGLVLGGVGVVGLASFAYFGAKSRATYDELDDRCAPLCGESDRDDADRGKTQQLVANIGLVVGGVALIAGTTLVILHASSGPKRESARRRPARRARWQSHDFAF